MGRKYVYFLRNLFRLTETKSGYLFALMASSKIGLLVWTMPGAVAQGNNDREGSAVLSPAVELELAYTADVVANLRGGRRRGVAYLDNVDVTATLDLEQLLGWRRMTLFLYGIGNQGGQPSNFTGDVQGVDNIETINAWRIYEAFLQRRFLNNRLSVLAGLYDINSEFDVLESALVFLNSSFGMGADFALSRPQGPSIFPFTSLGIRARALFQNQWFVQVAAMDGVPGDPSNPRAGPFHFGSNDGLLLATEAGLLISRQALGKAGSQQQRLARRRRVSRIASEPYRGKLSLGLWYYTARFETFTGAFKRGNVGAYLLGQWRFFHEPGDVEQGLRGFVRLGVADDRVNHIAAYTGGGFVYTGLLPKRRADQMGIGVAIAHGGGAFKRVQRLAGRPLKAAELAIEVTYSTSLLSWMIVQGDVQYIRHPYTDPTLEDALVIALRVQLMP